MKNTVQDKKRLSIPRLDAKHTFHKKRLSCSKTNVLTQNGLRPRKTVILTQNNEKTVKDKNRLSQPRLGAKRTFYK